MLENSIGTYIMCVWFFPVLVPVPGDAVLTKFLLTFLLTTFMAAQTHKKLYYVERGCYMNILFDFAWFVPVKVKKLCTNNDHQARSGLMREVSTELEKKLESRHKERPITVTSTSQVVLVRFQKKLDIKFT